jgi:hypothetical protein
VLEQPFTLFLRLQLQRRGTVEPFFKTAVSVIKLRETGKNTNTSCKEKQKKMTNQRNRRKSKRRGENIGPKHAAA